MAAPAHPGAHHYGNRQEDGLFLIRIGEEIPAERLCLCHLKRYGPGPGKGTLAANIRRQPRVQLAVFFSGKRARLQAGNPQGGYIVNPGTAFAVFHLRQCFFHHLY